MRMESALQAGATLHDIAAYLEQLRAIAGGTQATDSAEAQIARAGWLAAVTGCASNCAALLAAHARIADQCRALVSSMSFGFLFDRSRGLFSIGYRIADGTLDSGFYDLLASEARLASLVAIAKGDVPRSQLVSGSGDG